MRTAIQTKQPDKHGKKKSENRHKKKRMRFAPPESGLFEIGVEAGVEVIGAFCGFDEHEAQALAVDFGCGKCVPIDLALMMAYVDSAYGIALGVSGVAKDALPGYGVGTDEEGIKGYGAEGEKQYGSRPRTASEEPARREMPLAGTSAT